MVPMRKKVSGDGVTYSVKGNDSDLIDFSFVHVYLV